MPGDVVDDAVGRQQGGDEEEERPRGEERAFDQFPGEHGADRHRQGQQEGRFPVSEEVGVGDDQVGQEEKEEQAGEQQEDQPLNEEGAEARKTADEAEPDVEELEREEQVTDQEAADDSDQQAGLVSKGQEAPAARDQVGPEDQGEG